MDIDYFKITVTIFLAVIGWLIGHYFTTKRDLNNKKREIVIHHLIDAYRVLIDDVAHRVDSVERNRKLEKLLADIQLFGSSEQIQLAKNLCDDVCNGDSFELTPLIKVLRDDLRSQLRLSEIEGNVKWLRFNDSGIVQK